MWTGDECDLEGGSRQQDREGPLAELRKCTRHDIVRIVADDRRPQRVVVVATVCTVSERYDGDLWL